MLGGLTYLLYSILGRSFHFLTVKPLSVNG